VNCLNTYRIAESSESEYATDEDFCRLFTDDVESLYLLSFLLTANQDKAERCFLAGLDDCVNGISVFHEWVDFWARRAIVHQALRMTAQHTDSLRPTPGAVDFASEGDHPRTSSQDAAFARVVALEDSERFVFVLSVLEGYPDESCALVLVISGKEVLEVRTRSLQHIADFDRRNTVPEGSA
jgi:hypothetical protein